MASPVILLIIIISIASGITTFCSTRSLSVTGMRYITPHVLMIIAKGVLFHPLAWLYFFVIIGANIPLTVSLNYAFTIIFNDGGNTFQLRRLLR